MAACYLEWFLVKFDFFRGKGPFKPDLCHKIKIGRFLGRIFAFIASVIHRPVFEEIVAYKALF